MSGRDGTAGRPLPDFLSDEYKDRIRHLMRDFPADAVERFVEHTDFQCSCVDEFKKQVMPCEQLADITRLSTKLNYASRELVNWFDRRVYLQRKIEDTRDNVGRETAEKNQEFLNACYRAWQALRDVKRLINPELLTLVNGPGRQPADEFGLAGELAKAYLLAFRESPSETKTGRFYELIQIAFEALDLPATDPSRPVKSAIDALDDDIPGTT